MFTAIFLILGVFQIYEFYLLFRCFFEECRLSRKKEVVMYGVLFLCMNVPYLLFNVPMITFAFSFGGCLATSFIYEGGVKKKLLSGIMIFAIMLIVEFLVAIVIGYVNVDLFKSSDYFTIFGTVCLPIIQYFVIQLVRNFKNIKSGENVPTAYWIVTVMIPVFSVYLNFIFYRQTYISPVELVGCIVGLLLMNVMVFYLYDRLLDSFQKQRERDNLALQNRYQAEQLQLMEHSVEQIRKQRHDFIKHISMLSYLNEQGERLRLDTYIEEIQEHMRVHTHYIETGNTILDGVINYKIQEAESKNVEIQVHTAVPEGLELPVFDTNVILSNLLDNSIEAVRLLEGQGKVSLEVTYRKNRLNIRITNPYIEDTQETRKRDDKNHGYGLMNVREAVERQEGVMEVDSSQGEFRVFISLFMMGN